MKILESGEDYLEMILMLSLEKGYVRSVDIASGLGVTKPSVSVAMRKLRESGYIEFGENSYITLTQSGREIAERMLERHKIITELLVKLGVDRETAALDACRIEHVISDESFSAICNHSMRYLGKGGMFPPEHQGYGQTAEQE